MFQLNPIKKANKWIESKIGNWDLSSIGYKVNKYIFRVFFIVMLVLMAYVFATEGFGAISGASYIECSCDSFVGCKNPYYDFFCDGGELCKNEYLEPCEVIGEKPSILARSLSSIIIVGFILLLVANHFLYNRNWRFKGADKK